MDDEEDGHRDYKENVEDKSEENKAKTVKKRHSDSHSGLNKWERVSNLFILFFLKVTNINAVSAIKVY